MELAPYIDRLRSDLALAAEAAGPEARAVAERLTLALDSAVRMTVLEALSDAAAEVTQQLPGAAVDVRLKGRDPQFAVTFTEPEPATTTSHATPVDEQADESDDDEGAVARITVRLPESVKSRAEEVAAARGQSLNAWIVQALRLATREHAVNVDIDLSSLPFGAGAGFGPRRSKRVQGWVR
jgi:antitoxin component of RelBE/YafQ-DinJ toxin-antitoxin module